MHRHLGEELVAEVTDDDAEELALLAHQLACDVVRLIVEFDDGAPDPFDRLHAGARSPAQHSRDRRLGDPGHPRHVDDGGTPRSAVIASAGADVGHRSILAAGDGASWGYTH